MQLVNYRFIIQLGGSVYSFCYGDDFISFLECPQPYYFDVYNSSYGQNKWLLSCSLENCLDEKLFSY